MTQPTLTDLGAAGPLTAAPSTTIGILGEVVPEAGGVRRPGGADTGPGTGTPGPARISFTVLGDPVTQGSMRAFRAGGAIRTVHNNAAQLKPWRHLVATAADIAMAGRPVWDCAVAVDVTFLLPLPTGAPKGWRRSARWFLPWRGKDLDKFVRALFDSLSGVVFRDDSRVVLLTARKVYADGTSCRRSPGAFVICWVVTPSG